MAGKPKKEHIKKRRVVPLKSSPILTKYVDSDVYKLIKKLIRDGSAFIVLGGEFAPTQEFYKGLCEEMYKPTSNGIACYDVAYKYRYAWDRPIVTISINDNGNKQIVDSIKRLDRVRTRTLYSATYEEEQ